MRGANHFTRRAIVVATVGAGLLVAPGAAFAGVASVGADGIPRYQAAANEANNVTVQELDLTGSLKQVVYRDAAGVTPGAGCGVHPFGGVECNVDDDVNLIRAGLEDENDRIAPASVSPPDTMRFSAEGEGGNDVLIGTGNNDVLDGEGGEDSIFGRDGDDKLEGATGTDTVRGENGADTISGGAQADTLIGGLGGDTMLGLTGNDTLNADDNTGGDTLDCGEHLFDDDVAVFNLGDSVEHCETLSPQP